jgi:hypothetical protein
MAGLMIGVDVDFNEYSDRQSIDEVSASNGLHSVELEVVV